MFLPAFWDEILTSTAMAVPIFGTQYHLIPGGTISMALIIPSDGAARTFQCEELTVGPVVVYKGVHHESPCTANGSARIIETECSLTKL